MADALPDFSDFGDDELKGLAYAKCLSLANQLKEEGIDPDSICTAMAEAAAKWHEEEAPLTQYEWLFSFSLHYREEMQKFVGKPRLPFTRRKK